MRTKKFIVSIVSLFSLMLALTACRGMERKSYDITFNSNGGTLVETQTIEHDKTLTRPENPTKEGHTFIDWYSDEALTTVYDFTKRVRNEFTLYANWNVNKYTISYVTNVDSYTINNSTIEYGSVVEEPEVDEELFVVEGYHFIGWYLDADFQTELGQFTMPAKDITLYAKWDNDDHVLTFINDDLKYKVLDVKYGDSLPEIELPTKVGHTFAGWTLENNGTEVVGADFKIEKDTTLYSKWTKNKYTVTFDSNGGTAVQGAEYYYYDKLTAPTAPTKEGYTFTGWYLNDEYYNFNDSKMPADNITLVAKWNINSYTIKFNTNGGTQISDAKVVYGEKVVAPTDPTKTGYTFAGWFLNNVEYDFDTLMPANNVTLEAKWTINQYTITFDSVQGSEVTTQTHDFDATITAPTAPTKEGHTFAGWYLENTPYVFNKMPAENITLVANWTINTYTVEFNSNGGTEVADAKVVYGTKVSEPAAPTKKGYTFAGWFLNDVEYDFNTLMPANDIELVGKWTANEYTISFNLNGAEGEVVSIKTKYNEQVKAPECIDRLGYTFIEWNTKADGSGDGYKELADLTNVSTGEDVTLYAIWTHNEYTLTITLSQTEVFTHPFYYGDSIEDVISAINTEKEEAEFDGWYAFVNNAWVLYDITNATMPNHNFEIAAKYLGQVTITFVSNGQAFNAFVGYESEDITDIVTTPTLEGYTFAGWYLDEAFETEYNLTVYPTEDINVYAKWTVNTITVKFDGNGATSGEMDAQSIVYGSNTALSTNAFQKTGNKFLGWSTNKDATEIEFADGYNKNIASKGEITLYAVWQVLPYTITFNSNGGSTVSKIEQDYGTEVTAPTAPTKEGHTFAGWLLNGEKYTFTTMPAENITLIADWTVNEYTIVFNSNGGSEVESQTYLFGADITEPTVPTKTGYTFAGWYLDDQPFVFTTMLAGDIELVADWTINKYTITFDTDGGSSVDEIIQDYGTDVDAPTNPTRDGYEFAGWFLNDVEYTFTTMPAENITLEAHWNANKYTLTINTTTITYDEDGNPINTTDTKTYDIYHGELVLGYEVISKGALEGYKFSGWHEDDGLTVTPNFDESSKVEGSIVLYAEYTIIKYKVQFISNGETLFEIEKSYNESVSFNEYVEQTRKYAVAYGQLAAAIADTIIDAKNAAILNQCLVANTEVYYYSNTALMSYIGVLMSGGSLTEVQWQQFYGVAKGLYDSAQSIVNVYDKIGDDYVPNREGYFFDGWELGANTVYNGGKEFTGYTPANDIGGDVVKIVAKWVKLDAVEELGSADEKNTIEWTQITIDEQQMNLVAGKEKMYISYSIYTINQDGSLNFLAKVNHIDGVETLKYTFTTPGYYYNLVVIANVEIEYTHDNGRVEISRRYESDIEASAKIDEFKVVLSPDSVNPDGDDEEVKGQYYTRVGNTFYLFTNMNYNFPSGSFIISNTEDSKYISFDGSTIITNNNTKIESIKFINTESGIEYEAYILPYVLQFTKGKGLTNFEDSNSNDSFYGKNATYTIGRYYDVDFEEGNKDEALASISNLFEYKNNGYRFDLNILTNGGKTINILEYGEYLDYTFYDSNNNEVKHDDMGLYDYYTGAWSFTAPVGNYKVEISINDLYVAKYQLDNDEISTITFEFALDNSVNVYNNEQLKAVYNNTSIGSKLGNGDVIQRGISIHNNIESKLDANQYYKYYKTNNISNPLVNKDIDDDLNLEEVMKTDSPINVDNSDVVKYYKDSNYVSGNVYERVHLDNKFVENYTINGNCFTIDGSKLPFVNIHSRGNQSIIPGYYIPYTTNAIFKYIVKGSKLTFNDLMIVGNSTKPVLDESSENFQTSIQLLNKNSGGYQGIGLAESSALVTNNVVITKAIIGVNFNSGSTAEINGSKMVDCWFNAFYGYGNSDLTINNSYFADFGGAIIHLEDLDSKVQYKDETKNEIVNEIPAPANINIDTNSVFINYVSGDEGFFKTYSLEVLIMQMKTMFESNVSGNKWTMLKKVTDPVTKLESEKVNLIMLMVARGDNAETEEIDKEQLIYGAGRNMMKLSFDQAHTPMKLSGLNQILPALGMSTYNYLDSSLLMDSVLGNVSDDVKNMINNVDPNNKDLYDDLLFKGTDVVVTKQNPVDYPNSFAALEEGMLITYSGLPGFGGSIIVTGVNANPLTAK